MALEDSFQASLTFVAVRAVQTRVIISTVILSGMFPVLQFISFACIHSHILFLTFLVNFGKIIISHSLLNQMI